MKIFDPNTEKFTGWAGNNPFFLMIGTDEPKQTLIVDLDEWGWMREREGLMRATGEWLLVAKRDATSLQGVPVLAVKVFPGEQPYYVRRHVGALGNSISEVVAHGIGKKRTDGHTDRLWVFPNGIVCGGDDVNVFGSQMVRGSKS